MIAQRIVTAETLDHLPPTDPAALRSRRDLARVHKVMATGSIMMKVWQELLRNCQSNPVRILELGAGDGTLLLGLARALPASQVRVQLTLLDRQNIVSQATLTGYAELGWQIQLQVVDVLDWAAEQGGSARMQALPRWDLITTTLFLHHFESVELESLLTKVAASADRFFACEPKRAWLALAGSYLVGAIGANAVTRQDAVLSVRAGFRDREISAHWPLDRQQWRLREFAAGLFSHGFSAQRIGAE